MTITKLNNFLTKAVMPLDVINIVAGLLIGLAHVFLPLPTLGGFLLGCLLTLSSSYMIGINYFFTSTTPPAKEKEYVNSKKTNFFIVFSLLMMTLSMINGFFGTFTHLNLLIPAVAEKLGFTIGNNLTLGISIIYGINFAASTLIHAWIHIHSLWNRLRPENVNATKKVEESTNVIQDTLKAHPTLSVILRAQPEGPPAIAAKQRDSTFHPSQNCRVAATPRP